VSEPVGPQYGLEPLRPELHEPVVLPVNSKSYVSEVDYREGSEFGGVPGLIQPAPHTPNASERLMSIYAIDPADDGLQPESVLPPELEGNFNSEY
jgi:hypothetical protein